MSAHQDRRSSSRQPPPSDSGKISCTKVFLLINVVARRTHPFSRQLFTFQIRKKKKKNLTYFVELSRAIFRHDRHVSPLQQVSAFQLFPATNFRYLFWFS